MCGISGYYGARLVADHLLKNTLSVMKNRGPDYSHFVKKNNQDKNLYLLHSRLSIIDLDDRSNQPFSIGPYTIVFNGEIYNYKEIKKKLIEKNYKFRTQSDTEVLLYAFIEFGVKCLDLLEGMWSFAIWDDKKKKLLLARDRFGEKPLFYSYSSRAVFFGSNPIAVSRMAKSTLEIDIVRIAHYLKYQYLPEGTSMFAGVTQVPAGTLIHIDEKLRLVTEEVKRSSTSFDFDFKEVFTESVRDCMVSDVPVGLALSGGVDSTVTLATISKLDMDISTFTLVFDDFSSDRIYAKKAAEKYRTPHYEIKLENEILAETIFEVLSKQPLPFGDSSIVPTFVLAREAKKSVKVLISGDGADEVLSGYNYYRKFGRTSARNSATYGKFAILMLETAFRDLCGKIDYSKVQLRKELELAISRKSASELWNEDLASINQKEILQLFGSIDRISKMSRRELEEFRDISSVMKWDRDTYLPGDILWKSDTAGMMASLEIRTPFLNSKVLNWAEQQRFTKALSKQTLMESIFGKEISPDFFSRKKSGFGAPLQSWFQNEQVSSLYTDTVGNPHSKIYSFIDFRQASKLGRVNLQFRWNLLALVIWLEHNA